MKIEQTVCVASTEYEMFSKKLITAIRKMQDEGLTVDVQYQHSSCVSYNHIVNWTFSALVLGQTEGDK